MVRTFVADAAAIALILLVWSLSSRVAPEYLVPAPSSVLSYGSSHASLLLTDLLYTTLESVAGFFLALAIVFMTVLAWLFVPPLQPVALRWGVAAKSVPVVALAPLLTVWFGNAFVTKAILAALICFFPILIGFHDGPRSTPQTLRDVAVLTGAGRWRQFWHIDLPSACPYVLAGSKVAAPLSVVGAIVAEFAGADAGIGHLILVNAYRNQTQAMVAGILIAAALGVAVYCLTALLDTWLRRRLRYGS